MIDDEEGKKGIGRVENNLKSVHLVLLKCAPLLFTPPTPTQGLKKNGTKKPKKNCSNIQHHHKKEEDALPRPRDIFLCVGLSLCLHPP